MSYYSYNDYTMVCRHVDKETSSTECKSTGIIPEWLDGILIYNGPGITKVGDTEYNHAFDSSAIMQKFTIKKGKVSYMNKFLESETYKRNQKDGKISVAEFGTPGPSNKGKMARLLDSLDMDKIMSDNALLTVEKFGNRFFAVGETPYYLEVDPGTLKVKSRISMNKLLSLTTQGVHYEKDEEGNFFSISQTAGITGPKYAIIKIPADGSVEKAKTICTLPCRWRLSPCYIHSLAMTKNFLVFIETPLSVSIMDLLSDVVNNRPFIEGLKWHDSGCLFHVIDRNTWKPVNSKFQYVSDPFFMMHFCSAHEENEQLVLEMPTYKDSSIMQKLFIKTLKDQRIAPTADFVESFHSYVHRYVLPLAPKGSAEATELVTLTNSKCSAKRSGTEIKLIPEKLTSVNFEGCCSNKKFASDGNVRFVYGMGPGPFADNSNYAHLVKLDLKSQESFVFKENDLHAYFPAFVPKPDAKDEDDGVLLSLGLKSSEPNFVCLLVIDAKTMEEVGRAQITANSHLASPLHGNFFPN